MSRPPYDEATALRALLASTLESVYFLDSEGRHLYGRTTDDAIIRESAGARFDAQRRAVMDSGEPVRDEVTFERGDGTATIAYTIAPVVEDGRRVGLVVVTRDVTERRRADAALRASESKFSVAFGHSPLALTITSLETGRLVEVNEGFVRISGYSREETIGRTPEELGLWVDPSIRAERFTVLREGGRVPDVEARFRVKNGRELIGMIGSAVVEINGRPCVLSSVVDITERKCAEEALRESEARIREFADTAPAMLWISDPAGACSFLSRGWYDFTGCTEEQSLGFGWLDVVHPDDRAGVRAAIPATPAPFAIDCRFRRADGEYRWSINSARPRFAPGGELLGYIGSIIDIADRKRAEQAKDEFLATLSHELRTPLTSAFGWVKLLARTRDPELLENGLRAIESSVMHQIRLIDELLDVSRIAVGKMHLDLQPLNLATIVESGVEMIRPAAEAKQIELRIDAPAVLSIEGDPSRLRQLVANLLSNAVKFTPAGGRVVVALRQRGGSAEVVVRDTGEGIDAAFLPHVFDRFRQADSSTTRAHGGLGIGLAVVASIAQGHGGTVHAESDGAGEGATFTLRIPLLTRATLPVQPSHPAFPLP